MSRTTPEAYFTDWLYDRFGPQKTNSTAGYYMRNSQLFVVRETLEYGIIPDRTFLIEHLISVAAFVQSVVEFLHKPNILNALKALADAGEVFSAGTRLTEYQLYANHYKNVTVHGGSIVHAAAVMYVNYTAFSRAQWDYCSIAEGSETVGYYPTQELFEDHNALVDVAWDNFRNP